MQNINEILSNIRHAKYFTGIDIKSGYHQILVAPEDQKKCAFVTPDGLYEFITMPFGLCNAPATFQRLMNEILRPILDKNVAV